MILYGLFALENHKLSQQKKKTEKNEVKCFNDTRKSKNRSWLKMFFQKVNNKKKILV